MGPLRILVGSGALAVVGIGITMARGGDFMVSRVLFWAAGIIAGGYEFWWQLTTTDPLIVRVGDGLAVGIAVFVILPMLFRWLDRLQAKAGNSPAGT